MKKLLYLILPIFLFSSCDEDEITLTARDATNVTSSTAEITIQLEADEDQEFDETGLLYSKRRNDVENGLAETIRAYYPDVEVLMGTSTAGIAHAAIAASILGLPMGYVRGEAKTHGRNNRIEGRMEPGTKVVVIEDLISTGGSAIEVVDALREAGADVLGIVSIFTYGMKKGIERLAAANVENHSLSNLDALVEVAAEEGYITPEWKSRIIAFRNNPSDESWINK